MEAIETVYKGIKFRSRLEARWAYYFDLIGLGDWMYEPEGFKLSDGSYYLPDFYIPRINMFCEVKPFKQVDARWELFVAGFDEKMEEKYTKSYTGENKRRNDNLGLLLLFGNPHPNTIKLMHKGYNDYISFCVWEKYAPVYWGCSDEGIREYVSDLDEFVDEANSFRFEDYKGAKDETLLFGEWIINNVKNGMYKRRYLDIDDLYNLFKRFPNQKLL